MKHKTHTDSIGNMKKPFTILTWLASQRSTIASTGGQKEDSSAIFVCIQTKDGFNFRSIDELIEQESIRG